jgi:hypothetical protein
MSIKKILYYIQMNGLNIFFILSWISIITLYFGFTIINPEYISVMNYYIKMYISLYLMYRFNIFNKVKFTGLDKTVVFTAAFFIFTTTALNEWLLDNISPVESRLRTLFGLRAKSG